MAVEAEPNPSCAVCRRRLLPGERAMPYVTPEGHEVTVCELCKVRAEGAGWLRPEQAAAATSPPHERRRPRSQLFGGLRRRTDRGRGGREEGGEQAPPEEDREPTQEGSAGIEGAVEADPEPAAGKPHRRRREGELERTGGGDRPRERAPRNAAGPDLEEAVAAFNDSELRRTVASLSRTLGEPRATAIAVRTAAGSNGARITVAWELAWYQWEVGPGRRRPQIRQTAKGETADQLRAADRNWNLRVGDDGRLERRRARRDEDSTNE